MSHAKHPGRYLVAVSLAAAASWACSGEKTAPPQEHSTTLPAGALARVGDDIIDAETVTKIASAQKIPLTEARSRAIHDALLAREARDRGLDAHPTVVVTQRGVLADALLRKLMTEAAATPSTPEEIAKATQQHWLDLDRPEAYRTVHAVVQVSEEDGPQKAREAQEVARQLAAAVKGVSDAEAFVERAKAVPAHGFEVRAEKLSPVTADGRVADLEKRPAPGEPAQQYDKDFAAAASRLGSVGAQTGPFRSPFGWHVVMLTAIQPPQRFGAEQLAGILRDEIVALRAKSALERQVQALQQHTPVRVERNALTLMDTYLGAPKDTE